MTGHLSEADRARIGRGGMAALSAAEGLALLDPALGRDEALLVPARLDVAGLRAPGRPRRGRARRCWRGLAGGPARPAAPRPRRRRTARGAAAAAGRAARGRAGPGAGRPGPGARRRGARARLGRGGRAGPGVQRPRLRLADRGRAAEPAERRDRAAAARHAGLRLPDPGGAGRVTCGPSCSGRRRTRRRRSRPAAVGGRGAGRDRGDGLPVPRRGARARRSCGSCWPRATDAISGFPADRGWDLDGPVRPRSGSRRAPRTRAQGGFVHDAARVRPGVLRDQPAGGAGDGPAAAAAARGRAGRRWSGPGSTRRRCAARRPGCSPGAVASGYGAGLAGGGGAGGLPADRRPRPA